MLVIEDVYTRYGSVDVLRGVSLEVSEGAIVTLIGANGAGKTTLLKTISGLIRPVRGRISFYGRLINNLSTHRIVKIGISHAPEGRKIFPRSTVLENLEMGAYQRTDRQEIIKDINHFFDLFPILGERTKGLAGLLSGGEQQMLAISRALMARPKLLLLDEPSLGLAPFLVNEIFQIIQKLHEEGRTILLVEQNAYKALRIAQEGYVLEGGNILFHGFASDLLDNDSVRKAYLGG